MDVFDIVAQKSWEQLSETELAQLSEMGIDQQYFSMLKQHWSDFANQPSLEPTAEMKSSLDAAFAQQYGDSNKTVASYWKWMAAAAVGLLVIGVGVSVFTRVEEPVQLAKVEPLEQEVDSIQAVSITSDTEEDGQLATNPVHIQSARHSSKKSTMDVSVQEELLAEYKMRNEGVKAQEDVNALDVEAANTVYAIQPAVGKEMTDKSVHLSASSSNSTQNSVLAYRKMKEEENVDVVVFESAITKPVSLNGLNVRFKGLVQLY